jgi:hypothetical protein
LIRQLLLDGFGFPLDCGGLAVWTGMYMRWPMSRVLPDFRPLASEGATLMPNMREMFHGCVALDHVLERLWAMRRVFPGDLPESSSARSRSEPPPGTSSSALDRRPEAGFHCFEHGHGKP